jgi:hypothetical protein
MVGNVEQRQCLSEFIYPKTVAKLPHHYFRNVIAFASAVTFNSYLCDF